MALKFKKKAKNVQAEIPTDETASHINAVKETLDRESAQVKKKLDASIVEMRTLATELIIKCKAKVKEMEKSNKSSTRFHTAATAIERLLMTHIVE